MKNHRVVIALALAVVGLGTAIPVLASTLRSDDQDKTLHLFQRRATAADRLPSALGNLVIADRFQLVRVNGRLYAASRFVDTIGRWKMYAVPGRGGSICLVGLHTGDEPVTRGGCSPATQLLPGHLGVIANWSMTNYGRTALFTALVANGITAVEVNGRRWPVVDNVFSRALPARKTTLRLIGDGGRVVRLSLGGK